MGMQGGGKLWHHQKQHSLVMPIIQLSAWLLSSVLHVLVVDVIARSEFSDLGTNHHAQRPPMFVICGMGNTDDA